MPYRLVRGSASDDVVEVLTLLLENARLGNVTGIVLAATMRKSRYITTISGACMTNPTFARGMLLSLSDELGQMSREGDLSETR